jgi:hypothetical protein
MDLRSNSASTVGNQHIIGPGILRLSDAKLTCKSLLKDNELQK